MRFLSYIESTGTQYIDTGHKPSYNSRVVADVSGITGIENMVFGTRDTASGSSPQQLGVYRRTATTVRYFYFGTYTEATVSDVSGRAIVEASANKMTWGSVSLTNTAVASGVCSYPLYLFAMNSVGSPIGVASFKLYSCQIYDNGTLVRDFVPAENDDGEIGLYDRVKRKFYGNAGTGTFLGGEALSEMLTVNFTGLTNGSTYYARVFPMNPKGAAQSEIETQLGIAVPSSFPAEPSEYTLIGTYTSAQTWTAPEDGWFKVEVFGASGNGGKGVYKKEVEDDEDYYYANGGGGGGGGAYAASAVKLKKGDTVTFASLGVGSTATLNFNSSIDVYSNISAESGKNGGSGHTYSGGGNSSYIPPSGGKGGTASGGNISNIKGSNGGKGTVADGVDKLSEMVTTGGAGGKPGHTDGRTGGKGGYFTGYYNEAAPTNGKAGFVRISRGNTNVVA